MKSLTMNFRNNHLKFFNFSLKRNSLKREIASSRVIILDMKKLENNGEDIPSCLKDVLCLSMNTDRYNYFFHSYIIPESDKNEIIFKLDDSNRYILCRNNYGNLVWQYSATSLDQTKINVYPDNYKPSPNKNGFVLIAEMKPEVYSVVKFSRLFSLFIILPVSCILIFIMNHFNSDQIIFQLLFTFALVFLPYVLTENFVVHLRYETNPKGLLVTKMNFFGNLYSKLHTPNQLIRVHRKNNLRVFRFFKNKVTQESFDMVNICDIKNPELLEELLPPVTFKSKRQVSTQRLIDKKMNKSENIKRLTKRIYYLYVMIVAIFVGFQTMKIKEAYRKYQENKKNIKKKPKNIY